MKDSRFSTMMIDLDSLLDTRLSVINSFGITVLRDAFANKYSERIIDQWEWLDNATYTDRYRNRNKSVLKDASRTNIVKLVKEFIKITINESVSAPIDVIPKVIINVYPYQLADKEIQVLKEVFITLLDKLIPDNLIFVNMSPAEITPSYVKANISSLVMYEWWPWLDLHLTNGNFNKVSCPETHLTGPEIFFNEVPDVASMQKAKISEMSHFEALALCVAPHIHLELMDSSYFSMDMGFDPDVLAEIAKNRSM